MSDAHHEYRPFASGPGIFVGIVILWAGSYGLFYLAKVMFPQLFGLSTGEGG